ncbi:hypothetical protein F5B20DRAFT_563954 [Whalleya microplaca]|nr:hypothetical protein F5B20DRAFT_563954 [Whalleya microplaca]
MESIANCSDPTHGGRLQYFPPAEELKRPRGRSSLPPHIGEVLENHRQLHMQYHQNMRDLPESHARNHSGNLENEDNKPAEIDHEHNCALWIAGLPSDIDHHEFLSRIRSAGKVYRLVIYPPKPSKGLPYAAARLRFFDRRGVNVLLSQARQHTLTFRDLEPQVNQITSAARPDGPESRVLIVEGPVQIVNIDFLHRFFEQHLQFDLDVVYTEFEDDWHCRQQWHFGSYRQQAERAHQALVWAKDLVRLSEEEGRLWQQVQLSWGTDPCAN